MLTQAETTRLARRLGTGYGLAFLGAILWLILGGGVYWLYILVSHGSEEGQSLTVLIPGFCFLFLTLLSQSRPRMGGLLLFGVGLAWLLVQLVAGCILLLEVQIDPTPFFIKFIFYTVVASTGWLPIGIFYAIALFSPLIGSSLIYAADKRLKNNNHSIVGHYQE